MLAVHQISKTYHLKTVLKDVSFTLNPGERVGLIGRNGCGKTTLLRILAGVERADHGYVSYTPGNLRVGYLPQQVTFDAGETLAGYLNCYADDLDEIYSQLEAVSAALEDWQEAEDLVDQYDQLIQRLTHAQEGVDFRNEVLARFKLVDLPLDTPLDHLSGGQKMRLALAGVMLNQPQMLLLDEPTNHLDIDMCQWVRDWLQGYSGGVMLVSHDRTLLDETVTQIMELPENGGNPRIYAGNYTDWVALKQAEAQAAQQAYKDQQDEIRQLQASARVVRSKASAHKGGKADPKNTDGFSVGFFKNRGLETVRRAKALEKRASYLMQEGALEKPRDERHLRMAFADAPESGRKVLQLENLCIGYAGNALLEGISQTVQFGQHVAITGSNGCGKTTLLKTIEGTLPPLCGVVHLGSQVKIGYLAQEQETLDTTLTVLETIQRYEAMNETKARRFLHQYLFLGDSVFQQVGTLSLGQRTRLMLAILVTQQCNLLLFDEPLNHLDLPSRTEFEQALTRFEGTIIAISHERYFINRFARVIWHLQAGVLQVKYPEGEANAIQSK